MIKNLDLTLSERAARRIFFGATIFLSTFLTIRSFWSAPPAPWLSNFWFIRDIDILLSGNFEKVTWFTWGGGQATNGYRWFEYANAYFFNFDPRVELIIYSAILATISIIFANYVFKTNSKIRISQLLLLLLVESVIFNLVGAAPRGMEIGQFSGLALLCWLFSWINRQNTFGKWKFTFVVSLVGFILFFVLMGGYALGATIAFMISWLITRKSNKESAARLLTGTYIFAGLSMAYAITMRVAGSTEESAAFAKLWDQITADPLYIFKFFSVGPSAGLMSVQTLERFAPSVGILTSQTISLLILGYCAFLIYKLKVRNLAKTQVFPILLISYGLGTMAMLFLFRPDSPYQLLNQWYALHFKVMICGIILLTCSIFSSEIHQVKAIRVHGAFAVFVALVVISASYIQFERQNSERGYFLNVAAVELFPELIDKSQELSPLMINQTETDVAIETLKKYSLSPYANYKELSLALGGSSGILVGGQDSYGDGWVGKTSKIVVLNDKCRELLINLEIPDFVKGQNLEIKSDSKTEFGGPVETGKAISISKATKFATYSFSFSQSVIPANIGVNADQRNLAAKLDVQCK